MGMQIGDAGMSGGRADAGSGRANGANHPSPCAPVPSPGAGVAGFSRAPAVDSLESRVGTLRRLISIGMAGMLGACASVPKSDPAFAPISPNHYPQPAPAVNGAIYREGAGGLSLFADKRAFYPGDIITVLLSERTVAQTKKSTSASKSNEISIAAPTLLGAAPTYNGRNPLDNSLTTENKFSGSGDSDQSNSLTGSLTVTVAERLPNGNLLVRGEKLLRLNRSDEVIQIQGIVRPADIGPDNSVASSRVADARIVYTGRGELAQTNAQGWLSRFFNSVVMP
ncbi:MAG TPA: flagellar basal body L-ring protein FlgH [Vicinamibacterales bacterium]|nr:flagellar basal body L-ring protein FlgH [Vicinamibacterales bacterium]